MKPTINTLIISTVSSIGILCFGCQENTNEILVEEVAEIPAEATAVADLSDNLDLEVVVALFGESENLEDFEKKLNEPEREISNLDLNEDGEVDYLRVVESSMDQTYLVNVQAVLGEDLYQDVASFDVEKDQGGQAQVQVVGDPYIYGQNYVVRPTYVRPPLIAAWFWGASYRAWRSPYSYGRYPSYYRSWSPYPSHDYRKRVSRHKHSHYSYGYRTGKRNKHSVTLYSSSRRNDYGSKYSGKSFNKRNKGSKNRYELTQKRRKTKGKPGKPASKPGKPASKPGKPSQLPSGKPSGKSASKSSGKSASKSSGKSASKPSGKSASKPSGKSASKPSGKSTSKPFGKSASKSSGKSASKSVNKQKK